MQPKNHDQMYHKDSPATIQSLFNHIARRYDRTNAILSFSLHKIWNRTLVKTLLNRVKSPQILLDLCSGTGDIAFEFLRQVAQPCHAYLVDFSSEMLHYAKQKDPHDPGHQLSYIEADVQNLPLSDHLAHCATMAYGIRNVKDPSRCIRDVFRVLKPGGSFGILELTRPPSRVLRIGHSMYLKTFLPLIGKWLTQNGDAYRYLRSSIETFIEPKEIENLFIQEGFMRTECRALAGGIATIIVGDKPLKM